MDWDQSTKPVTRERTNVIGGLTTEPGQKTKKKSSEFTSITSTNKKDANDLIAKAQQNHFVIYDQNVSCQQELIILN